MAANYWVSTQYRYWQFDRARLAQIKSSLEQDRAFIQQYPLPDSRLINIYINQQLVKLSKRMNVRQQAIATAQIYIKRFYTKVEVRKTNPYLLLTTAFYLACKTEECPQHIRLVVGEARGLWPEFIVPDGARLGECEFWLISELNSQLIVHQPYRTLSELQSPLSLTADETALAWSLINDHYLTDLPLLQPPHVIAVMAIFIAVVFKPSHHNVPSTQGLMTGAARDLGGGLGTALDPRSGVMTLPRVQKIIDWLSNSDIDIEAVIECTQEIISLYEAWEQYSEKACKEQIGKYVKAASLDK